MDPLHRVSEEVLSLFPDVGKLISSIKKSFLKFLSRIQTFKDIASDIPQPPQPIVTRWGTWISAAIYYASNSLSITKVVNALEDEGLSIVAAKKLLESSEVKNDLIFFAAEFGFLTQVLCQVQARGQPQRKSVKIVDDEVQRLETPRKTVY